MQRRNPAATLRSAQFLCRPRPHLWRNPFPGASLVPAEWFVENYFNYFTEIEEHFQRRRGGGLLLSTLDWALIETWKDAGIPLEGVLRGIDGAFERYEKRPSKRKVNSLAYCAQEVLAAAEEMKEAAVGVSDGDKAKACRVSNRRNRIVSSPQRRSDSSPRSCRSGPESRRRHWPVKRPARCERLLPRWKIRKPRTVWRISNAGLR